ncbi:sensor histidine kinase [Gilvimarinus sp. F26214L]|uniref:sensor histidine kinase n=1 Tax=Gilvimarinus sp. DZF01 TaxID=3461371 RepID=UPI00404673D5
MILADLIEQNPDKLIARWKRTVAEQLGSELDELQLVDDLPPFLECLVTTLRSPAGEWPACDWAQIHGRQRMQVGLDIAGLTEEMSLLQESVLGLAREQGVDPSSADIQQLMRVMGRGTALAVRSYFELWERKYTDEVAQHFAFVAHQIRNPLNSATLIAEILGMVPEEQREGQIARLRRSLTRLSKLVDDSLIDARLRGTPELDLQRVTVAELVEEAYNEVAFQADEREVIVERNVEPMEWEVDPKLMLSAMTNLFSTALKFSCRGGRIRVQAQQCNDEALFTVEDQCGGLPEDFQLFEPVRKKEYRTGFGLGLSLVKQVVEAHHGTIDVHNNPGEGCSFLLNVPRQQGGGEVRH